MDQAYSDPGGDHRKRHKQNHGDGDERHDLWGYVYVDNAFFLLTRDIYCSPIRHITIYIFLLYYIYQLQFVLSDLHLVTNLNHCSRCGQLFAHIL